MARWFFLVCALLISSLVAMPLSPRENKAAVTVMTAAQVAAITPFAWMANAAYCSHSAVSAWKCGSACTALPGMQILLTGGDNSDTPDYYVGYLPSSKAIVVSHQGTNVNSFLSLLEDAVFNLVSMSSSYFPGLSGVEVHDGFQSTWELSANAILSAVQSGISSKGATQVYVVGHSMGAAIALLDALYLREKLSSSIPIHSTVFGLPRVGNQAFANYVDAHLSGFQHVTNDNDIVPRLPSTDFGYEHPSGEVFITKVGGSTYDICPGQENYNCAIGILFILDSTSPHDGPYASVMLGSSACTA